MKYLLLAAWLSLMAFPVLANDKVDTTTPPAAEKCDDPDNAEILAYSVANDKMMHGMMHGASGDADRDFVTMMVPHHQGAIDMAKIELEYGKDPQLKALAAQIMKAQQPEIDTMKKWQDAHPMQGAPDKQGHNKQDHK